MNNLGKVKTPILLLIIIALVFATVDNFWLIMIKFVLEIVIMATFYVIMCIKDYMDKEGYFKKNEKQKIKKVIDNVERYKNALDSACKCATPDWEIMEEKLLEGGLFVALMTIETPNGETVRIKHHKYIEDAIEERYKRRK